MSETASKKSYDFLKKMGVNVYLNTAVKNYDGDTVVTDTKNFQTKTVIWSAGVKGAPVPNLEGSLNRSSRIITDEFGLVKGYEDIYAIGDVASIETIEDGKGHPMLASVASQQGHRLGKNLNLLAKGKAMKPFQYNDRGTMATIGRHRAVVDLPFFSFTGIFAWFVWMFLHLMLLVDFRNRLVVFTNWAWSYFRFDKGLRLIIREVKSADPSGN